MNIITISREFGSGGRELGKRMADILGYDYYDSEIISSVAEGSNLDARYVENALNDHGWQNFPITFHGTIGSTAYLNASKITLLVQQKEVIHRIAAMGKDCVIVGRNADVILADYQPFNIFVCADTAAKVRRCMDRAREDEQLTEKELLRQMKQIDRNRARTRTLLSGTDWGCRDAYQLIVNSTNWSIKQLAGAVAAYASTWFGRDE